jgi:hypothetical protein
MMNAVLNHIRRSFREFHCWKPNSFGAVFGAVKMKERQGFCRFRFSMQVIREVSLFQRKQFIIYQKTALIWVRFFKSSIYVVILF